MTLHLLVATDFSEPSNDALDYVVEHAKSLSAKITVVHVYEIPSFTYEGGRVGVPTELASSLREAALETMKKLCASYAKRGVTLAFVVRDGLPWQTIESVASEIGADWIVVGTHGRRGLSHAVLGSVAERVVRTSTRPVLTVRTKRKD